MHTRVCTSTVVCGLVILIGCIWLAFGWAAPLGMVGAGLLFAAILRSGRAPRSNPDKN